MTKVTGTLNDIERIAIFDVALASIIDSSVSYPVHQVPKYKLAFVLARELLSCGVSLESFCGSSHYDVKWVREAVMQANCIVNELKEV